MPNCRERIIIEDDEYGRLQVSREPAPDLEVWRGCGPERGEYEARHAHANDNGAVRVEYQPPGALRRAAGKPLDAAAGLRDVRGVPGGGRAAGRGAGRTERLNAGR